MTAALAVCMAGMAEGEIDTLVDATRIALQKKKELPDTPVAILIGGDISGIQKFIYTISSKKAAQTLRGRSFYLQLLTEAILRSVLRELGLPYANVIYSGGGHFFLLAPVDAKERLPEIRKMVTQKMLQHHGTSLYFALGSAEVPASGFKAGKFPEYWSKMHADLGRAKQQRYTELGQAIHGAIFSVPETGGNPDDTCSVCGGMHSRPTHSWIMMNARPAFAAYAIPLSGISGVTFRMQSSWHLAGRCRKIPRVVPHWTL